MRWMGIDGGGSHLRVVIVDDNLRVLTEQSGESANPNSIGQQVAAERIRNAVSAALAAVGRGTVTGVGVGIAGASARHAADWLESVLRPVLPRAQYALSSDEEIALVGGRGRRDGVVLLAGTGSTAYGVAQDGRVFRSGGWGYLLGDEGSGYWIGLQALRAVTRYADGRLDTASELAATIMKRLGISTPDELIAYVYREARPTDIAALTRDVLALPDDPRASAIIDHAAHHLAELAVHVAEKLDFTTEAITFAGTLLTTNNPLSEAVVNALGLPLPPTIRYPPVIGAALLAKLKSHAN